MLINIINSDVKNSVNSNVILFSSEPVSTVIVDRQMTSVTVDQCIDTDRLYGTVPSK